MSDISEARKISRRGTLAAQRAAYARKYRKQQDTEQYKAKHAKQVLSWRKRNPEKTRVYRLVRSAIAKGLLVRPNVCPKCGMAPTTKDGRSAIHAHHDDYSKPLEVHWICMRCHALEHWGGV